MHAEQSILDFFRRYPLIYLPLFILAVYLAVVLIRQIFLKLLAVVIIVFAAWVGYFAFIADNHTGRSGLSSWKDRTLVYAAEMGNKVLNWIRPDDSDKK
ncbi:MAG: hypothetical protein A2293_02805 [Elusimicrobia bacterium RIFOXYB2_FULL_49_7]|nr:MAG: hypothetical protein A2293_02805 [Elusimicrobia bacterium RIFOXYB2_FULL_49_7]